MKKSIIIIFLAASFFVTLSACNNTTPKNSAIESKSITAIYTCTMHPEVRSDKPGDCPKCGMALVKMETADSTHMHNESDTTHMMN